MTGEGASESTFQKWGDKHDTTPKVSRDECRQAREYVRKGHSCRAVVEHLLELDCARNTLRRHAYGECSHSEEEVGAAADSSGKRGGKDWQTGDHS